jgi:hypothetical protein
MPDLRISHGLCSSTTMACPELKVIALRKAVMLPLHSNTSFRNYPVRLFFDHATLSLAWDKVKSSREGTQNLHLEPLETCPPNCSKQIMRNSRICQLLSEDLVSKVRGKAPNHTHPRQENGRSDAFPWAPPPAERDFRRLSICNILNQPSGWTF